MEIISQQQQQKQERKQARDREENEVEWAKRTERLGRELQVSKLAPSAFARLLVDSYDEECDSAEDGRTRESVVVSFEHQSYLYQLVDTPGHKQYIRAMIAGASALADIRVVCAVVSAAPGEFERAFERGQTREQLTLARAVGIPRVIVLVNKMDLVSWSQERFTEIRVQMEAFLRKLGWSRGACFVPIAALGNVGLAGTTGLPDWLGRDDRRSALDAIREACDFTVEEHKSSECGGKNRLPNTFPTSTTPDTRPSGSTRTPSGSGNSNIQSRSTIPSRSAPDTRSTPSKVVRVQVLACRHSVLTSGYRCTCHAELREVQVVLNNIRVTKRATANRKGRKPDCVAMPGDQLLCELASLDGPPSGLLAADSHKDIEMELLPSDRLIFRDGDDTVGFGIPC